MQGLRLILTMTCVSVPPTPPQDHEPWKSSDKICRQLIYHLTPHSKRKPHRKTQNR